MGHALDLATRTLFEDFQETVFARSEIERSAEPLPIYVQKRVKEKVYWYLQAYEGGIARQTYVGPDSPSLSKKVNEIRAKARGQSEHLAGLKEQEIRIASMLSRGGLPLQDRRISVILSKLSDARLIDGNGVLVGTFAFAAYSGILGILLDRTSLRTQDIDIAQDPQIELAHSISINADDFFTQPGLECRAVPSLSRKAPSASFITKDGVRIDLLVPMKGAGPKSPQQKNILGAGATAIRFLDYLIEKTVRTVLTSTKGGIPISVPSPERFAIHKLIVASYRPAHEAAKRSKDLLQASELIQALSLDQDDELRRAYKNAISRGPKWKKAILKSLESLPEEIQKLLA